MTTHITRSGNTQRIRLVTPAEANATGKAKAQQLLANVALPDDEENSASAFLYISLVEFIALALDNRFEEWNNRLAGFCDVIGPVMQRATELDAKCALLSAALNQADRVIQATAEEQRAIDAAIATCSQVSAGRIIAAHPNDDDAIVTLCELQMAVRALEPKFTESEGGEL